MDLGLTGKRALVLASSGGLGRGIAEALAREGARVAIASRRAEAIEAAAREIADATGAPVAGHVVDLADRASIDWLTDRVLGDFGGIDVLVNNTGGPPPAPALAIEAETWRQWFDTMVVSLVSITGRLVPGMRERRWGRVLTVTSNAAVNPLPNMALSNALRASLHAWNKTLAAEVAADGVTCNILVPGRIHTSRVDALDAARAQREGRTAAEVAAESQAGIPVGRYGRVEEFADVACFLASERASYVTGMLMRIDGGMIRGL